MPAINFDFISNNVNFVKGELKLAPSGILFA